MQITDTRVRLIADGGKMLAIASVTFDDQFVVHDIKVIEGEKGVFIAMPSRKDGEGRFRDIAHPLDPDTRHMVSEAVMIAYNKKLNEEMRISDEEAEKIARKFF